MTNKEAVTILRNEWSINAEIFSTDFFEALDLAIKVLKNERPKGEWIMNKTSARGRNYTCTHCNKVSRNKFAYCPNCGADMRKEVDND